MVICGLIGAVTSSVIADKAKAYKITLLVASCLNLVFIIASWFVNFTNLTENFVLQCIIVGILGACSYPAIPLCYLLSAEFTHPMHPSLGNGLLNLSA